LNGAPSAPIILAVNHIKRAGRVYRRDLALCFPVPAPRFESGRGPYGRCIDVVLALEVSPITF
jgi:hypothetical protein